MTHHTHIHTHKQTNIKHTSIAILATGGTIAGTSNNHATETGQYDSAQLDVSNLVTALAKLPDAHTLSTCTLHGEQIAQIDSKDMNWNVWQRLRQRVISLQHDNSIDAIVILHGSDTLEETAFFLHASVALSKPLVITCAMRPADAADADGGRNMLHSIALAQQLCNNTDTGTQHLLLGVCAGKAWHAIHLRKQHTQALNAFSNALHPHQCAAQWRGNEWAFNSFENQAQHQTETHTYQAEYSHLNIDENTVFPTVATLCSHACVNGNIAKQLLENMPAHSGLLVETTGSGTIHQALYPALSLAQDRGITLARSSRCMYGEMQNWAVPHHNTQAKLTWLDTRYLHVSKARVLLALHLLHIA